MTYIIRSEDGVQTFHIEDGWQGDDEHATQFSDKAKALFGTLPGGGKWEPLKRWYVTVAYEEWPHAGVHIATVSAHDDEAAEELCRREMAALRAVEGDLNEEQQAQLLEQSRHDWHLVDCVEVDPFICRLIDPAILELMGEGLIKMDEEQELMSGDGYEDEDRATFDRQYKAAQALYERTAGVPFYGREETPALTPLAV